MMRLTVPVTLLVLLLSACGSASVSTPPAQPAAPSATPMAQAEPPATATASPAPTQPPATVTASPAPTQPPATVTASPAPTQPPAAPTAVAATQPPTAAPTRPAPTVAPVLPPNTAPVTGETPSELLERIIADLLQRTGAERQAVSVTRAEAVTWPDGSLGCPQPGMVYPQVLIDGYWVVLAIGEASYDYRADERGRFSLCEKPGSGMPPVDTTR